jgi:hypothetical protein
MSKNDQLIRVKSLLLFHVFRLRSSHPDMTSEQTPVSAILHSTPQVAPNIFYYPGMLILLLWVSHADAHQLILGRICLLPKLSFQ